MRIYSVRRLRKWVSRMVRISVVILEKPRKGSIWSRQRQNFIDYLGSGDADQKFPTIEEAIKTADELT